LLTHCPMPSVTLSLALPNTADVEWLFLTYGGPKPFE
jgi:hypothetical protein